MLVAFLSEPHTFFQSFGTRPTSHGKPFPIHFCLINPTRRSQLFSTGSVALPLSVVSGLSRSSANGYVDRRPFEGGGVRQGRHWGPGCKGPAPVNSGQNQLLLFVKGGLRKKLKDVCLHPEFCLWNILEHPLHVTGVVREPSGWREKQESVSAETLSESLPLPSG